MLVMKGPLSTALDTNYAGDLHLSSNIVFTFIQLFIISSPTSPLSLFLFQSVSHTNSYLSLLPLPPPPPTHTDLLSVGFSNPNYLVYLLILSKHHLFLHYQTCMFPMAKNNHTQTCRCLYSIVYTPINVSTFLPSTTRASPHPSPGEQTP